MAIVTAAANSALKMNSFDVAEYTNEDIDVVSFSSTLIVGDMGDGYSVRYTGFGFQLTDGEATGGTITGFQELLSGTPAFTVSGLNVGLPQFAAWGDHGDSLTALTTMFAADDSFQGSALGDHIIAFAGHDNVFGGGGADTLIGGDGNDHLYGQSADGGADGADSIDAGNGSDYLQGNAGNDTLNGGLGSDRINGGADNDSIIGAGGNDVINGNRGHDTIGADDGDDLLRGGQDDDVLAGGNGSDTLSGDKGIDALTGGAGNYLFQFAPGDAAIVPGTSDRITDYADGSDHIVLGFGPAAVLTGAAQASLGAAQSFAQTSFDGHGGDREVAALQVGSDTYLFFAGNAANTIDSIVLLQGVSASAIGLDDFL